MNRREKRKITKELKKDDPIMQYIIERSAYPNSLFYINYNPIMLPEITASIEELEYIIIGDTDGIHDKQVKSVKNIA